MDIILMTVLLTIAGVCLVAFFTLLGIASYKLMKFKRKADGAFKHLERWIDDNNNSIIKNLEDTREDLLNIINENNNNIHTRVNNEATNTYNLINKEATELNSKIDSRCDKLNSKFEKDIELVASGKWNQRFSLNLFDKADVEGLASKE